jgi:hypothetical protein
MLRTCRHRGRSPRLHLPTRRAARSDTSMSDLDHAADAMAYTIMSGFAELVPTRRKLLDWLVIATLYWASWCCSSPSRSTSSCPSSSMAWPRSHKESWSNEPYQLSPLSSIGFPLSLLGFFLTRAYCRWAKIRTAAEAASVKLSGRPYEQALTFRPLPKLTHRRSAHGDAPRGASTAVTVHRSSSSVGIIN